MTKRRRASATDRAAASPALHSRQHSCTSLLSMLLLLIVLQSILLPTALASTSDYLNEKSVVLITGAAGFVGSELAMALYRTYGVERIICVDSMDSVSPNSQKTEEELALFEFKRQRAFHLMQTLGRHAVFYRADFRPSIPEYFDVGEVPILDYLVRDYPDITHVVHLAEDVRSNTMVIPRTKEDVSSGMMEALLEQVLKFPNKPHFVYGSSFEVYNHLHPTDTNPPPFDESKPITTPSSLAGASKIIDELLAKMYYETHEIFSIGLRFFSVYGPWGVPGSPLFEMAERAVTEAPIVTVEEAAVLDDVRDYVYIDDAVDALLAAMQYRTPNGAPVVMNVGTGQGTSLRQIARQMEDLLPRSKPQEEEDIVGDSKSKTRSYASIDRAKLLLGYHPRVSLEDGLVRLLSWHYDRAFPYGGRPISSTNQVITNIKRQEIAAQGIASCSPFDKECLRGAPVFPCASECSHDVKCTSSYYDDVLLFTRALTKECTTVMYTVEMHKDLQAIPSANMAISTHHSSHLPDGCNIAFVSESSALVKRLKTEQGFSVLMTAVETFRKSKKVLKHGFWTLVPVSTPTFETGDEHILNLLPKLSPGLFFGQATTHAIYCDPNVVFKDVPTLLQEAKMQPYHSGGTPGATSMLVARERPNRRWSRTRHHGSSTSTEESIQNAAYRMVRIGVIDEMSTGDGSHPLVDSSWVVHSLLNEDSRLFRCDVFGEVVQWNVGTDERAFEFIMGLHDMWSRVLIQEEEPWWLGDAVVTVPQYDEKEAAAAVRSPMRRLQQVDEEQNESGESKNEDDDKTGPDSKAQDSVADDSVKNDAKPPDDDKSEPDVVVERRDAEEEVEKKEEGAGTKEDDSKQGDTKEDVDSKAEGVRDALQVGDINPEEVLNAIKNKVSDEDDVSKPDTDDSKQDTEDEDEKNEAFANKKDNSEEADKQNNEEKEEADKKQGSEEQEEADKQDSEDKEEADKQQDSEEKEEADKQDSEEKEEGKENQAGAADAGGFLNAGDAKVKLAPPREKGNGESDDEEETKDMGDTESQEDDEEGSQAKIGRRSAEMPKVDHSSYDTWMGVLSSTSTHYFVRIVLSSEVGATYLDDYKY